MMLAGILLQAALTVGVPGPPGAPEALPLQVAEAQGYFAAEGARVTLRSLRSEAEAAQALARGAVDLAATSLDSALRFGHRDGVPPRLVLGLTEAPAVALVAAAGERERVRSAADLAGRVVGVPAPGTPEADLLDLLLERARVSPAQVSVRSYGARRLAAALAGGELAAGVLGEPWLTRLLADGRVVPLVDARQAADRSRALGEAAVHGALFLRPDASFEPALLVPVVRAVRRAIDLLRSADPDTLASGLPRALTEPEEAWRARLAAARGVYLVAPGVTPALLAAGLERVRQRAPLPAAVRLPRPPEALLLTEPLEAAR